MRIQNIQTNYNRNYTCPSKASFKSNVLIGSLKNKNIGEMANGCIGKLEMVKANSENALLNLMKSTCQDYEIYKLTDDAQRVIGCMELRFNKYAWKYNDEKDHVFVSSLKNYSNPKTPYYTRQLDEYKHVGTKLLQIALKRSQEGNCEGNIELIAKSRQEVYDFYKFLGFEHVAPVSIYENPNRFRLSGRNVNILANKYGGL